MKKEMLTKRILSMLLILSMIFSLTACGGNGGGAGDGGSADGSAESAETYAFVDDSGREVEVASEITRIVPSGPLAQIVLFSLAPEMLVGLSTTWYDSAKGIIADEYFELPYFGQMFGSADLNMEELALADPQVVIDIGEAMDSIAEDLDTLQTQTGIPCVFISATLKDMPTTYRTLGKLLGKEEKAEELAEFCEETYSRAVSIMEQVGENKVDALYILGEDGLNVLAADSYHAELIDMLTNNLAVVDNPISKGTGNAVDMEQISLWNPEFVVFAPDSIYSEAGEMDAWGEVTAIKNGNYVEVPDVPHNWMGMPPSVQRYLGLIWLPAVLYPEYCDYDVKAEIMEYYKLFYDCELTDAQYEEITANAFKGQ